MHWTRMLCASLLWMTTVMAPAAGAASDLPSCASARIEGEGGYVEFQTDSTTGRVVWGAYMWDPSEDYGWWNVTWFQNAKKRGLHAKHYPPHHSYPPKYARKGDVLTVMGWHHSNRDVWYRVGGQCVVL